MREGCFFFIEKGAPKKGGVSSGEYSKSMKRVGELKRLDDYQRGKQGQFSIYFLFPLFTKIFLLS